MMSKKELKDVFLSIKRKTYIAYLNEPKASGEFWEHKIEIPIGAGNKFNLNKFQEKVSELGDIVNIDVIAGIISISFRLIASDNIRTLECMADQVQEHTDRMIKLLNRFNLHDCIYYLDFDMNV